ncbi:MAG: hypothetical protein IKM29_05765 [Clostridia bacterium]|nr:hypothetical protein [Clostridia bacterium]
MTENSFTFRKALPIWKKGEVKTMNMCVEFSTEIPSFPGCELFVSGHSSYLVFVNGELVAHGPARAAHGFYKVDRISLDRFAGETSTCVLIRASGYNCNAFSYVDAPSFVCAEIVCGEKVLAATGEDFVCRTDAGRIRKTPRYSYQRTFAESYDFTHGETAFDGDIEVCGDKFFICRDVPYGEYAVIAPQKLTGKGTVVCRRPESYSITREHTLVSEPDVYYKGYEDAELESPVHKIYQEFEFSSPEKTDSSVGEFVIPKGEYLDLEFEKNYAGLVSLEAESEGDATLYVTFDEIITNSRPDPFRINTNSIIPVRMNGKCRLLTSEPYIMKYARLIAVNGDIKVRNLVLREIAYPHAEKRNNFKSSDEEIQKIYDAAYHTFRTNVVDIYMDCASRERAGWLCDSFFMSRSEKLFTGKSLVERAFLKNFLLPEGFDDIPEGMLPMCYPADALENVFIPNWAMWYGLELYEYLGRSGDRELIDEAKERLYGLLDYFRKFENELGLLEKLEGWVFLEWSHANSLTQEVNFPTNMLYAAYKSVLGLLYSDEKLIEEARELRKTINEVAMTESGFYCDNAFRENGELKLTGERTEVCQYYAFFMKCATPETHRELKRRLVENFGSNKKAGVYDDIYPANAFIGNYMRLDLLLEWGEKALLKADIRSFFAEMAELTGSLWEHMDTQASCSHGFASYAAYWIEQTENI